MVLGPSLSIILPFHNAEKTLASQVLGLLEVLPELTSQFEVLIVDDGSTDQTEEVAHDLSREFPQLQVAHHARREGAAGAVATGLKRTRGEFLLVHDGRAPVRPDQFRRLWERRSLLDPARRSKRVWRIDGPRRPDSPDAASAQGQRRAGGIQMIRRPDSRSRTL